MKKIVIMSLCGLLLITTGCKQQKEQKEVIKTVKVDMAATYGEKKTVSFPGKVKAASEVNLAFRISGPITKVNVTEGQFVRKDQVLAEMDSRDYAVQLSATEAEYKQVKAEAERIIQLYEKQSISENDYDKAVSGLQQIMAKYNAHQNALSDTKLRAPFDGYIQKRYFDRNETVSAGMPLFSMISAETPEVEINIPAGEFIQRDQFDSYSCYFELYPDRTFPLELISINRKANLNQLYTVRLRFKENPHSSMPSPGMSTMVTIRYKPENTTMVSIPLTAMFEVDNTPTVWVYDERLQIINARTIRISEILTDGTMIVSEGLNVGEQVVSAGVHKLSDGEKVKLLPQATKTNVGGLL
ncbi:efflux RND transporter periplasmic adaptor subunit [Proteiniphilum acetatigenes]|uniref:efflux RND transporter periplasmic adaptor subunit n=1 Tax=Proteiniphilum acetatigenes TaxID=294710 RepID=UPI0004777C68|nr:efflux RND transporter periplasmic adaptor subunit [Proteiniphilum acetatigenes]SFK90981.1 RND family efflux transporter, MFP subunit [Porphyromonadaceae bacterium KH3CP3RA]